MRRLVFICLPALCWGAFFAPTVQGTEPTALEVRAALHKAAGFFHEQVSTRGGYLWAYSGDEGGLITFPQVEGLLAYP